MDRYTLRFSWGMCCHRMQSKDVKNATGLRHTTCSCENLRVEHISQAILFWAIRPPQYKVAEPTGVTTGYREDQSPSCRRLPFCLPLCSQSLKTLVWSKRSVQYLFLDHHEHIMGTARVRPIQTIMMQGCNTCTPACCGPVGAANIVPDTRERSGYFTSIAHALLIH